MHTCDRPFAPEHGREEAQGPVRWQKVVPASRAVRTQQQMAAKVQVVLQPIGGAPRLKKNTFMVPGDKQFAYIIGWLRKTLKNDTIVRTTAAAAVLCSMQRATTPVDS
eukprot:SAG31_NODE_8809_length_1383_cov_1.332555_2_plen_108_part_00